MRVQDKCGMIFAAFSAKSLISVKVTSLLDAAVKAPGWPATYEVDSAVTVASTATEVA